MIILASASPRRRELLGSLGLSFDIQPATGSENTPDTGDAAEAVRLIALGKARQIAALHPEALVIGADTVVELDGHILGKPADEDEACAMLRALSGRTHRVYTGVAVISGGEELDHTECTQVRFRPLTEREIAAYVAGGEPMDKAGAYAAQGKAALFVEGIEGDYFNVVGLPLCALGRMFAHFGVTLL